ncbi:MAG: hypothetical protein WDO16_12230 [Bacteroidota bacterium]
MSKTSELSANWRYEYYFDKLYPMGIMSDYDKDVQQFKIKKINKILFSNLKSTNDKIENEIGDNALDIKREINYNYFFSDYIIKDWVIRQEYEMLVSCIIRYYVWNNRNLDDILSRMGILDYFELEIDNNQRIENESLLIITSKVPGGIESSLVNQKGETLFVDIYGVPQLDEENHFIGLQNVIPIVNERRKIYLDAVEKEVKLLNLDAEVERTRVIDHITKGIYLRLSVFALSPRLESKECLHILAKVLGYTLDWRQARRNTFKHFNHFTTVNFISFLNSIYIHALVVNKSNIEYLPISLLRTISGSVTEHISETIGQTISMTTVKKMIKTADCWQHFEQDTYHSNNSYQTISEMKLLLHTKDDLFLKVYVDENGKVDMYNYYILIETFFEIFVNHIKHNQEKKEKGFHVWTFEDYMIFSNAYYKDIQKLDFFDVNMITAGNSQYGLISLEKEFETHGMIYGVYVILETGFFAQKISWKNDKFFSHEQLNSNA